MFTIDKTYQNLIEIKKSKFISYAYNVETPEEIEEILNKLNLEYKDATHICYAFVLSSPNLEKACDNGEPDGTAGKPILDVIKKNNLSDVLVVVIRYFGGIKLGAGGLVRAYSSSAGDVIKLARIGTNKIMSDFFVSCDIANSKSLLDFIRKFNLNLKSQVYSDCFTVNLSMESADILKNLPFKVDIVEGKKVKVFYDKDI